MLLQHGHEIAVKFSTTRTGYSHSTAVSEVTPVYIRSHQGTSSRRHVIRNQADSAGNSTGGRYNIWCAQFFSKCQGKGTFKVMNSSATTPALGSHEACESTVAGRCCRPSATYPSTTSSTASGGADGTLRAGASVLLSAWSLQLPLPLPLLPKLLQPSASISAGTVMPGALDPAPAAAAPLATGCTASTTSSVGFLT